MPPRLMEGDRGLPTDAVLVSLINDLDPFAGPTVVALDDYHLINELRPSTRPSATWWTSCHHRPASP